MSAWRIDTYLLGDVRGEREIDERSAITGWRLWPLMSLLDERGLPLWRLQIKGWEWWFANESEPKIFRDLWPLKDAMPTRCRACMDAAPKTDCRCGVYAYKARRFIQGEPFGLDLSPPLDGVVLGKVSSWGRIVEHERGWRTAVGRPDSLSLVCLACFQKDGVLRHADFVHVGDNLSSIDVSCRRHHERESLERASPRRNAKEIRVHPYTLTAKEVETDLWQCYGVSCAALGMRSGLRDGTPSCEESERLASLQSQRQRAYITGAIASGAEVLERTWEPWPSDRAKNKTATKKPRKPTSRAKKLPADPFLVYGQIDDTLIFIPRAVATSCVALHKAVRSAKTWGQFKRLMGDKLYRKYILDHIQSISDTPDFASFYKNCRDWDPETTLTQAREEYDALEIGERIPKLKEPFKAENIPGYGDGDWPLWPQQEMLKWMPKVIQKRYGSEWSSRLNGDALDLSPDHEKGIVKALMRRGYICQKDEQLVRRASGYDLEPPPKKENPMTNLSCTQAKFIVSEIKERTERVLEAKALKSKEDVYQNLTHALEHLTVAWRLLCEADRADIPKWMLDLPRP
jgi:hypothetical protein